MYTTTLAQLLLVSSSFISTTVLASSEKRRAWDRAIIERNIVADTPAPIQPTISMNVIEANAVLVTVTATVTVETNAAVIGNFSAAVASEANPASQKTTATDLLTAETSQSIATSMLVVQTDATSADAAIQTQTIGVEPQTPAGLYNSTGNGIGLNGTFSGSNSGNSKIPLGVAGQTGQDACNCQCLCPVGSFNIGAMAAANPQSSSSVSETASSSIIASTLSTAIVSSMGNNTSVPTSVQLENIAAQSEEATATGSGFLSIGSSVVPLSSVVTSGLGA